NGAVADVDGGEVNGEKAKIAEREGNADGDAGRRGRRTAGLALAFAATLPLIRVIPGIPTHDGARLIIASFPFIAILAALGATVFVERCEKSGGSERKLAARRLAQVVVGLAFAVGVVDLVWSAPRYLSFYNAALGGVVGATRRGMEATYYWDAFDADAVAWLNVEIAAARADGRPTGVLFGSFSSQTLDYYRRWGTLATSETETLSTPNVLANRERFGFYVVQRRPSGWTALELGLFKTASPIYRATVCNPFELQEKNMGKREVVLLEIYDFRDVERVLATAARSQEKKGKTTTR
ncbi:MAG: hypothetical protein IKY61_01050, partial [Thermoguttaceae bacterium]|nr:hypothetical protein [Thermoguttaceae bacterium]